MDLSSTVCRRPHLVSHNPSHNPYDRFTLMDFPFMHVVRSLFMYLPCIISIFSLMRLMYLSVFVVRSYMIYFVFRLRLFMYRPSIIDLFVLCIVGISLCCISVNHAFCISKLRPTRACSVYSADGAFSADRANSGESADSAYGSDSTYTRICYLLYM